MTRRHLDTKVDPCAAPQLMVTHYVTVMEITGYTVGSGVGVLYWIFTIYSNQKTTKNVVSDVRNGVSNVRNVVSDIRNVILDVPNAVSGYYNW